MNSDSAAALLPMTTSVAMVRLALTRMASGVCDGLRKIRLDIAL